MSCTYIGPFLMRDIEDVFADNGGNEFNNDARHHEELVGTRFGKAKGQA